jgi:hypothetical protein
VPYMGKGTFSIIVNQTEAKAKTPSTDSQFLIPGFPASKLRAEKMVLSSYGLKLSNGKGKVIKYKYPKTYPRHYVSREQEEDSHIKKLLSLCWGG